jgi:hypothetical protein
MDVRMQHCRAPLVANSIVINHCEDTRRGEVPHEPGSYVVGSESGATSKGCLQHCDTVLFTNGVVMNYCKTVDGVMAIRETGIGCHP